LVIEEKLNVMEKIVIEVNKATAKKWRNSSKQQKRKLATVLQNALANTEGTNEPKLGYARPSEAVLQAHFNRVQQELPEYKKFLDELGKRAAERGLTEEILEELLRDDA
jgi:hypothetical protein